MRLSDTFLPRVASFLHPICALPSLSKTGSRFHYLANTALNQLNLDLGASLQVYSIITSFNFGSFCSCARVSGAATEYYTQHQTGGLWHEALPFLVPNSSIITQEHPPRSFGVSSNSLLFCRQAYCLLEAPYPRSASYPAKPLVITAT